MMPHPLLPMIGISQRNPKNDTVYGGEVIQIFRERRCAMQELCILVVG